MPRVRLILEEDHGNPIADTEQIYVLEGDCDPINPMEAAVETFQRSALPPLEHALLTQAQERFVTAQKKRSRLPQGQKPSDALDLWNGALEKALAIDARLAQEVEDCRKRPSPPIETPVDLSSQEAEAVLGLPDAIGVTSQKPTREKPGAPPLPKEASRHATPVRLLEPPDGEFVYLRGCTEARQVETAQNG